MRVEEPHQLWHPPATLPHRLHREHSRGRAVRSPARRWHMQWWPPWPEEPVCTCSGMHASDCVRVCSRPHVQRERTRAPLGVSMSRKSCVARTGRVWLPLACVTTVVGHVQFVWVVRGHSAGHAGGVPSVMQVLRDSRLAIGRLGQAWSGAHHTKSPMT